MLFVAQEFAIIKVMKTSKKEYYGHPSREHWNVALWVGNCEDLYRVAMKHKLKDFVWIVCGDEGKGIKTGDGVRFTEELASYAWSSLREDDCEECGSDTSAGSGLFVNRIGGVHTHICRECDEKMTPECEDQSEESSFTYDDLLKRSNLMDDAGNTFNPFSGLMPDDQIL